MNHCIDKSVWDDGWVFLAAFFGACSKSALLGQTIDGSEEVHRPPSCSRASNVKKRQLGSCDSTGKKLSSNMERLQLSGYKLELYFTVCSRCWEAGDVQLLTDVTTVRRLSRK
ncbi:uncharacterized protein V6R79_018204 [Siganus canaliculatus]